MFGMEPDEVSADEVADAVGELTNMVGGNIKSLLPEPSLLSLPTVSRGAPVRVRVPGGGTRSEVSLISGDEIIVVHVWGRGDGDEGSEPESTELAASGATA